MTVPVNGYYEYAQSITLIDSSSLVYDSTLVLTWSGDIVVNDETEFMDQGLSSSNGDHDWACGVDHTGGYDDLQTYIKGIENKHKIEYNNLHVYIYTYA